MFKRSGRKRFLKRNQDPVRRPQPILKNPREIQIMREAGRIVARVHAGLADAVVPGVTTLELDQLAIGIIQKYNATSCFLDYRGFPAHICVSVNEELVHGIPSADRTLAAGDVVSIDVGVLHRGFVGDSAWSYRVGPVSPEADQLLKVTEESLMQGIEQARPGQPLSAIGRAVQQHVEANGLHVVREYTGHGVGREMHEPPQVLNYVAGDADGQILLQPGMVLAIEPMVQCGTWQTETLRDQWTVVSRDRSLAAHYEHTVAITNSGPEILTTL